MKRPISDYIKAILIVLFILAMYGLAGRIELMP